VDFRAFIAYGATDWPTERVNILGAGVGAVNMEVALAVPKRLAYAQRRFLDAHAFFPSEFGCQPFAARRILTC
jgi:hypothetical protein